MLFNSFEFIFLFLPVTLVIFLLIARWRYGAAMGMLFLASLVFYAWWNAAYALLLLASIVCNFAFGLTISRAQGLPVPRSRFALGVLTVAVAGNIGLLAYYKYANFLITAVRDLSGASLPGLEVILPLGISFFTFTQIAFLVDAYRGEVKEINFVHYGLFVTYFPYLIAGPVIHHKEVMPQFGGTSRAKVDDFAVGIAIFVIGLVKKVVLADSLARYANPVFTAYGAGESLSPFLAWAGALAYTFQLYFDFSAYSDMAIGVSRLFGVVLPLNFHSPYKAESIIDFWRRWHMTLSRFLRDYVYIPLGGGRKGEGRRYLNLTATMLLGGLWHGAGWTYILWGAFHGGALCFNHLWRSFTGGGGTNGRGTALMHMAARGATFVVVVVGWVLFRAESAGAATAMLREMAGQGAGGNSTAFMLASDAPQWIIAAWIIAWFAPNTQEIMRDFTPALDIYQFPRPALPRPLLWRPTPLTGVVFALLFITCLVYLAGDVNSEFLYFAF